MKSVAPATFDTITNDYHNEVGVVMHVEWRYNRYYRTVVDNTPTEDEEGYEIEMFPIESITKSDRPTSGINKAVVGQAVVEPDYIDEIPDARYYISDPDDQYKYWQSPYSAAASTFVMTKCAPHVLYVEEEDVAGEPVPIQVNANKIVFTVENTFASPVDYDVQVKYAATDPWVTVASDIPVPSDGLVELRHNSGTWSVTSLMGEPVMVHAVRLVVNSMNKQAYFNLIELGLALEVDISDDVATYDTSFSLGESDFITPLGTISSNTASVTLFNDHGMWTNSNPSGYFNLLDKGVRFRCWLDYGGDLVQEFEMYSDVWSEDEAQTEVSLVDGSVILMQTKPQPVLYREISVQEAIWRTCDSIGFNKYAVATIDNSQNSIIDIFWTDGEKTAWELFGELSRATQTAIYFDSYGVLQVKTRDAAWNNTMTPQYDFIRDTIPGGQPANVMSLTEDTSYEANKVTVNWHPTGFSEKRDNIIPFEVVWEPDGDIVLRATELAKSLMVGDDTIHLKWSEGRTWPWKGMCQIEGEWIAYEGKKYTWYDETNTRRVSWVKSLEEQKKLDAKTNSFKRHLNSYSGVLKVKERGLFNTEEKNHYVDIAGWSRTRRRNYSSNTSPSSGIALHKGQSMATITGGKGFKMNDYTYLHRGNAIDQAFRYYGTRLRVERGSWKDKCGGMMFNIDDGMGTGYYIEIMATSKMNGKMRKQRNELIFYSMKADGSKKVFGGEEIVMKDKSKDHKKNAKIRRDVGRRLAVPAGKWIDIDVFFSNAGSDDRATIYANGRLMFTAVIPGGSGWKHSAVGRYGLYSRGHSRIGFDYMYAINSPGVDQIDNESYFDRIEGAYRANQWQNDWTYETRTVRRKVKRKWKKRQQRYKQRYYEEFGPVAHEIREFNVKFQTELPVLESKLYFSNRTQAVPTEYVGTITGARFIMANIRRENAIISGDDERTAMGNGTINHKLFVYGRPVIQKDAQKVERTDEWALRRRGPIEIEYDSPWIQNESEAEAFADWLTTHWTRSDTKLSLEVFGNPLIELGDVVHVDYNNIDDNYYVIGITNNFENGLSTALELRKVTV